MNNIIHADDTVEIVWQVTTPCRQTESSQRHGLDVNINKTKLTVISIIRNQKNQLIVNQKPAEQVNKYSSLDLTLVSSHHLLPPS